MTANMNAKSKVTGLKAKSVSNVAGGKDPKKAITSLSAKNAGVDMPDPKSGGSKLKAKSVSKMG